MADGAGQEPDHRSGHRARLRQRLLDHGPEALRDYEVVEYLLALTIPRMDTKRRAKELIQRFGGIGPLLAADVEALKKEKLSDATIGALKIAEASAIWMLKAQASEKPVLGSWQALIDYLHADMAHNPVERVRALFLNSKNMLIRDELMSEGAVDEAAVYVREILRRALDYQATAIILVHNHPSGDPQPSQQDIRLTREIIEAGKPLRVAVHDHVIVGSKGHCSLRGMGLI